MLINFSFCICIWLRREKQRITQMTTGQTNWSENHVACLAYVCSLYITIIDLFAINNSVAKVADVIHWDSHGTNQLNTAGIYRFIHHPCDWFGGWRAHGWHEPALRQASPIHIPAHAANNLKIDCFAPDHAAHASRIQATNRALKQSQCVRWSWTKWCREPIM